jgi:hypothetical protein
MYSNFLLFGKAAMMDSNFINKMVLCLKWNFKMLSETIRFYFDNKKEEKDPHNLLNIPLPPEHKRRNDLSNSKPFLCFRSM